MAAEGGQMTHLLITNDFPPKVGGIQSYLWELWRRMPPDRFAVLTTPYAGAEAFDVAQPFPIERTSQRVLLPTPALAARIKAVAGEIGVSLVVLDPALPLGALGPRLGLPYAVVVHGAEVSVPRRVPGAHSLLARVLSNASHVVAAGRWVAAEADRAAGTTLPTTVVPPGVDVDRFRPLSPDDRSKARASLGLPAGGRLVVGVSRRVPRQGNADAQ